MPEENARETARKNVRLSEILPESETMSEGCQGGDHSKNICFFPIETAPHQGLPGARRGASTAGPGAAPSDGGR